MQQKYKTLEDTADNILGCLKKKYSSRYFYQRLTQSESGSFYLIIRKKRGRLTEVEKSNLISNVEEIFMSLYCFYSRKHEFVLPKYFPYVKFFSN